MPSGVGGVHGLMRSLKDPPLQTVPELLQLGRVPRRAGEAVGGGGWGGLPYMGCRQEMQAKTQRDG